MKKIIFILAMVPNALLKAWAKENGCIFRNANFINADDKPERGVTHVGGEVPENYEGLEGVEEFEIPENVWKGTEAQEGSKEPSAAEIKAEIAKKLEALGAELPKKGDSVEKWQKALEDAEKASEGGN